MMRTSLILLTMLCLAHAAFGWTEAHLAAAAKVCEVTMKDIDRPQVTGIVSALLPDASREGLDQATALVLELFESEQFRNDYAKVIADVFTEKECLRLVDILADPVLVKFRRNKNQYMQHLLLLAGKHLLQKLPAREPATAPTQETAILGIWTREYKGASRDGKPFSMQTEVKYNSDGTAEGRFVTVAGATTNYSGYAGTWTIADDRLRNTVTWSTVPQLLPIGTVTEDKIMTLTDEVFVLLDRKTGIEDKQSRVKTGSRYFTP
jgi:hypothetical protein